MTWDNVSTQYLEQRSAEVLEIPLVDEDGAALLVAAVNALTATMTVTQTGAAVFTARNVLSSLGATTLGTLDLALTSDDLEMVTTREVEARTLTVSIRYASTKERHIAIPCLVRRVTAAADLTP